MFRLSVDIETLGWYLHNSLDRAVGKSLSTKSATNCEGPIVQEQVLLNIK